MNGSPVAAGSCRGLAVPPGWETAECAIEADAFRAGVNAVELRFAYAQRPVDVGAGGDTRPLAAAVDWLRVSKQ